MILDDLPKQNLSAEDSILKAAQTALKKQDYPAALQAVLPFLKSVPVNTKYLDVAVTCYWHLGDTRTALSLLQVLISLLPEDRATWGKMGAMLLAMGEKTGAAAAFERCLQLQPRSASALGALNLITPFEKGTHRARLLRDLAQSKKTSGFDRAIAWNACGRIEQKAGQFGPAFRCFEKSNKAQPARYGATAIEQHVDGQLAHFRADEEGPPDGPTCIFVVGLPRSGTTLVDTILNRHPLVRSTGEGAQLQHVLTGIRRQFSNGDGSWGWTRHVTDDDLTRARRAFLRRIAVPGEQDAPFVVNKLPLGLFDMGFAQWLLPGARFVFMSRDPLDVGLSNFCTHFHDAHPFAKSLTGIAHMTQQVYRSLDDYVGKLDDALRVQSYQALVTDPEPQIKALLAHVGLPFDPACLAPEDGDGAVRTASVMQVREAINTKGLGKWRQYEAQLQPLVDALGPNWLAAWAARDASAA